MEEARQVQFKLLELIETMLGAGNFPEGFREGVNLRGFDMGRARQPMSPGELEHFGAIREKLACLLAECGFGEAARHCGSGAREDLASAVDAIVRAVLQGR